MLQSVTSPSFLLNRGQLLDSSFFFPLFQTEAVRALNDEKRQTVRLMVETEQRNVDKLRQALAAAGPSQRKQAELDAAGKRLARLGKDELIELI